jgi:hypothetical protein
MKHLVNKILINAPMLRSRLNSSLNGATGRGKTIGRLKKKTVIPVVVVGKVEILPKILRSIHLSASQVF